MTERPNKWKEPVVILMSLGTLVMAGGVVWSAATIAAGNVYLGHSVDEMKTSMNSQFADVRARIADIPTQEARIGAIERQLAQVGTHDAAQDQRISTLEQATAVVSATVDGMRHDVQGMQDAINGRLPGQRK